MRAHWMMLIFLLSLALGSCGPSQTIVAASPSMPPAATDTVSMVTADATAAPAPGETTPVASSAGNTTDSWKTYHNVEAGYSVEYPADWTVNENPVKNGEMITTFTVPDDGQGIVVNIQNGETASEDIPDMPNTRCQPVTISGLSGRRCFDTIALSTSTTLIGDGKQYTIAAFGKHLDPNIYQHFLESFTVTP
jgi:hypothetical protein